VMSTRFSNSAMLLAACLMLAACDDSDVRLGREALDAGDPDKALNFFSIAAERNRTDANVRVLIGQVHLRKGNLQEAPGWFRQAQQLGYSGMALGKLFSDEAKLVATYDPQRAVTFYALAVEFDRSLAKSTAQIIVSMADQTIVGSTALALQLYQVAVNYDASLSSPVANKLSEAAAAVLEIDANEALLLYRSAVKYDRGVAGAASERISQVAISQLESDMNTALRMMVVAAEYNPALKKSLADLLTKSAIQALRADNFDRIEALTMHAIAYDPNVASSIANGAFERAKALGPEPKDWVTILRFARFARPLKGSDALAWGNLLYGLVTQAGKTPANSNDVIGMGRIVVDLDGTKRTPLAKLLVQLGTKEVEQDSLDLSVAVELYNVAIGFDASTKASVSNAVWENFSHRLFAQPPKLTKDQFGQYLQTAGNFGVPAQYANTVAPYAQALRQYLDGNRTQAISTFSQIAQGRPTSREGKAASSMLAPPPPNTIKFNAQPFHFNTWSYGIGGGRGVDIQLVSADVAQNGIDITFSVKSPADHPDLLLFGRNNHDGGIMGGTCELLYLLDDNGTKFYSISGGFQGGRQTNFNECAQAINFNAGEEVLVTARFPMISRGATTVKVVSPDPDRAGHQSEWWVANLQLKRGPFDAPPPPSPPKLIEPANRGVSLAVQDPALYLVANTTPPDAFVALRTLPSSRSGERIATMPNGTALQVLQRRSDGWWYVQVVETGQKGWALSGQSGKVWITER
jgi:tetratricopeptide (TPR) repeat protein